MQTQVEKELEHVRRVFLRLRRVERISYLVLMLMLPVVVLFESRGWWPFAVWLVFLVVAFLVRHSRRIYRGYVDRMMELHQQEVCNHDN